MRPLAHRVLGRVPILAAMALLLLPWAFATAAWLWPGIAALQERALTGIRPPAPRPSLTASAAWTGSFQAGAAAYFGQNLPLLSTAIGLKNQFYFSVLGQSGNPDIVVGKHLQLYERLYIDEYCGRSLPMLAARAALWARRLAETQAWYARQGRVFIYLITPSKAAMQPQDIDGRSCRSPPEQRDALLPVVDAALDQHGIRYVDAATMLRRAAPAYPIPMFPRGGTHWNDLAAVIATQAVVRAANAAGAPWALDSFSFTWRMEPPTGVARDLTDLLNLPYPRTDYAVPGISIAAPSAPCHAPLTAAVGGSFAFQILWTLERLPCAPAIVFYAYFHTLQAQYPGDLRGPVDAQARDRMLLSTADLVLLEENEQVVLRSQHAAALFDLIAAHSPPMR